MRDQNSTFVELLKAQVEKWLRARVKRAWLNPRTVDFCIQSWATLDQAWPSLVVRLPSGKSRRKPSLCWTDSLPKGKCGAERSLAISSSPMYYSGSVVGARKRLGDAKSVSHVHLDGGTRAWEGSLPMSPWSRRPVLASGILHLRDRWRRWGADSEEYWPPSWITAYVPLPDCVMLGVPGFRHLVSLRSPRCPALVHGLVSC